MKGKITLDKLCTLISAIVETSLGMPLSPDLIRLLLVFAGTQVAKALTFLFASGKRQLFIFKRFLHDMLPGQDGAVNPDSRK